MYCGHNIFAFFDENRDALDLQQTVSHQK